MSTLFNEQIKPPEYDATSLEYVKCLVEKRVNGSLTDPTADAVQMAFTLTATAAGAVWNTASWETTSAGYYVRCLVGPGGETSLVPGNKYYVWVKITDSPEIPVKPGGMLVVT